MPSRLRASLCAVAFSCLAAATAAHATPTLYYLTTGKDSAQTQIDVAHTSTWSFTATSSWLLGGGNFAMKVGSKTAADLVLSVYEGINTSGVLVATTDVTTPQFCGAHGGNCSSFAPTVLSFATPYQIDSGQAYYITLTSTAANAQTDAYFIKDVASTVIADAQGNVLTSQSPGPGANIPEPASLAILGAGFVLAGALQKRRTSRRSATPS
jgi:hypothetical protein